MRLLPIAQWNARGVRCVAFDVDDTVTRNGVVEAIAFDALHRLKHAGYRLVAVTGRPLGWAEVIVHLWPIDMAMGENGAGWFSRDDRGRIREAYFADEDERMRIERKHQEIVERVRVALPHVRISADGRLRRYDLAFDVNEYVQLDMTTRAELERLIIDAGATPVTSSVHCHASLGGWDKHRALVAAHSAFDPTEWVYIGDSGNDEAAFSALPNTIGVANVRDHNLETPPHFVTSSDRGVGFSEFVSYLLASNE